MLRARLHLVLLLIVLGLVLIRESREVSFQNLEAAASSWLHKIPLRKIPAAPVTLVEIDQECLREHPWPWTPLDFALFFQAANHFQPAVLASNEIFSWKEPTAQDTALSKIPQYRKLLRDHLLRSRKVVLGGLLGFPEDPERLPPLQETPLLRNFKGDLKEVPEFTDLVTQPDEDFRLSSAVGFLNPPPEKALHSSIPLVWRYRGQLVPSLTLQAFILWEKATLEEVSVHLGDSIRIGDGLRIPVNSRGEMPVNPHATFSRCSFEDLLLTASQKDNDPQNPPAAVANRSASVVPEELLSNRLVLLARTDPGSKNLAAPGLPPFSLGEWSALALATALSQSFPPAPPTWIPILIVCVSLLLALVPGTKRLLKPHAMVPAALLIYVVAAVLTFRASQITLPMILPAGLGILLLLSQLIAPVSSRTIPAPFLNPPDPTPASTSPTPPTPPTPPTTSTTSESPDEPASRALPRRWEPAPKDPPPAESIPIPPLILFPPKPLTHVPPPTAQNSVPKPVPSVPRPAFSPPVTRPLTEHPTAPDLPLDLPLEVPTVPEETPETPAGVPSPTPPSQKLPPVSHPFTIQAEPPKDSSAPVPEPKNEG